jgi:hypothetical protein
VPPRVDLPQLILDATRGAQELALARFVIPSAGVQPRAIPECDSYDDASGRPALSPDRISRG